MMLKDRVALVTGASRGIGRAAALRLAKEGAVVIVNYNGNKEKAEETVAMIEEAGGRAQAYGCDVADGEAVGVMVKDIAEEFGHIDILVNNAGITRDGLMLRMSDEDFDKVIATNLTGAFHCLKHVSKYMIKQKYGKIINMSSVTALMGNAGQVNYAAAKAGIIGMTRSAARELAIRKINVNAIAPGYIATDMTAVLSDNVKEKITTAIPLGRMGSVEDIAEAVLFLASDSSSYITGQVISVDGGMNM